ncbi:hypothetical protein QYF36_000642 [Acer negundo]|nr:hypothetical protein QYF36_000642 [Acer negundo]
MAMAQQKEECCISFVLSLVVVLLFLCNNGWFAIARADQTGYISAVGDPGMKRDSLRVAIESWNQCNEVGEEVPHMGSPRAADCFDIYQASSTQSNGKNCSLCNLLPYLLIHRVTEEDNKLGVGDPFLGLQPNALFDANLYAANKELYLGSKCQIEDSPKPWHFWMIMLKNGNMDTYAAKCPKNGYKVGPFGPDNGFPCFGEGCMNQPLIYHDYTTLQGANKTTLRGRFFGSWDLNADLSKGLVGNISYHSVTWEKEVGKGSWVFHHVLRTSTRYPWLMLYLRSDTSYGLSGGYHYPTRGMSKIIPESPNFKVRFALNVIKGGGPKSQFYLMDMGSCWKNNGQPCNGDVTSDVTRYSEMIINPNISSWCHPDHLGVCPPYHTFPNGTRVHRNDTARFPYAAYHFYCSPGNGKYLEFPYTLCDPYSNPQPQEIMQILPNPVWGEFGYPTTPGEGWIGDPRTWELDVGRLSQSLYFYQDPGTTPVRRKWLSIDLGTEIFKDPDQVAEWTVSDFDILVPKIQELNQLEGIEIFKDTNQNFLKWVTEKDNKLGFGDPFLGLQPNALFDANLYAANKELYLGSKCQIEDNPKPWHFWMIMLKNGNLDTYAAKCPKNGYKVGLFGPDNGFPCFGEGCMNQSLIYHYYTTLQGANSWDLNVDLSKGLVGNISYHSVTWEKEVGKGS